MTTISNRFREEFSYDHGGLMNFEPRGMILNILVLCASIAQWIRLLLKSRGLGFDPGSGHIHASHVSAEC
ncbi:hypothetical protein DPMN_129514 [Dreissena polymorpha]|uniref:Uncharacterized protein n=1 Tax=Dreissena polymorpha TaxID=45954 RepID=A0A9D4H3B3_DREPO|nr:hypothetical protein DPMN_129514 [Dreissena polymorpha]